MHCFFPCRAMSSYLAYARTICFAVRFERSGPPQIFNLWGERRQPSPNDVGVILCDRLAERERNVVVKIALALSPPRLIISPCALRRNLM